MARPVLEFAGRTTTKNVKLVGGDDLLRKLAALPDALGGAHLLNAVSDGAEIVRGAAESLAPRGQGAGKRGTHGADFIVTDKILSTPTRAEIGVGAGKKGFHLMWAEIGTVDVVPQPWLRPALDRTKFDVVDEIGDSLRKRVLGVARGG